MDQCCVYIITGHVTDRVRMTTCGGLPKGVREWQSSAGQTKAAVRRRERESVRPHTHTDTELQGLNCRVEGATSRFLAAVTLLLYSHSALKLGNDPITAVKLQVGRARPEMKSELQEETRGRV